MRAVPGTPTDTDEMLRELREGLDEFDDGFQELALALESVTDPTLDTEDEED